MNHDVEPRLLARVHRTRSPRIAAVLLLVAIVPLVGMGAATWRTISDARKTQLAATRTQETADQAVGLVRLQGAVFDEMVASAITEVAAEMEAPPALLAVFLGSDPTEQLELAQARTDGQLAEMGRPDAVAEIATVRIARTDLSGTLAGYREILSGVDDELTHAIADLSATTSGSSGASELARASRLLGSAIDARSAVAEEFYGYFATIFDLRDAPGVELARLIRSHAKYDASLEALAEGAIDQSALRSGVEQVEFDPGMLALNAAIDTLIADSLAAGVPPQAAPLSLDTVTQNLAGFTSVYEAASASSETTSTLLDAAVGGMLAAAADVTDRADDDITSAYLLALALSAATLFTALLAARFIVRPLRDLQRAAHHLQDSAEVSAAPRSGPAEVQAAAGAIQDAAQHLDLVTRQTRALAVGELDADVLDEAAPGRLGTAVQHAVSTLRAALAQQDEFRRRLAHEATHDGLTKLSNRNASITQLARSLARTTRAGSQLAVLFIDLDRFKDVNDHNGHHAGDTVLTSIAQRLVNGVREGDHVGRLGGDEFVVIAEPVSGVDEAVALAQRLLDAIAEPIDLGNVPVSVGASIGIALASGADLTAEELLRDADLAVYRAKEIGRGGIEICDEDLRNHVAETADQSLAIRQAIEHDELVVHYQPIIDTRTNELHALEALVRWQRPGHDGLIPPDRFIGFAERSNLIVDLDRWVIGAVARQIRAWHAAGNFNAIPVGDQRVAPPPRPRPLRAARARAARAVRGAVELDHHRGDRERAARRPRRRCREAPAAP